MDKKISDVVLEVEENPWKTKDSKVIYQNPWIKLIEDKVVTPNGKDGIYAYIGEKYAVAGVVLNEKNEVYLVGQYRYPVCEYSWEIIEGGVEKGEDYLTAVKREIKEEAGIEGKRFDILHEKFYLSKTYTAEIGQIFLVRDITLGEQSPDPTEKLLIKAVPFDDAIKLVYEGRIKDSFSIAGLLLAKEYLEREKGK